MDKITTEIKANIVAEMNRKAGLKKKKNNALIVQDIIRMEKMESGDSAMEDAVKQMTDAAEKYGDTLFSKADLLLINELKIIK